MVTGSLVLLLSATLLVAMHPSWISAASQSSALDLLQFRAIETPDGRLLAAQTEVTDVLPNLVRTSDIEKLGHDGFLVTQDLGFHVGFISYNIREDQSYRRDDITYWPLHDVEFRHALIHCYDQLGIIPPIYGYIVTPVRSLVPPAQSKYHNPAVPEHAYNPGDPFTSQATEHSTCGILKAANYTFVDADGSGDVTDVDYWLMPNGDRLPKMTLWWPLPEYSCTFSETERHIAEFAADLAEVGLAATTANGNHGFYSMGREFNEYLADVYDHLDFDAFMIFYSLERLPSHLYSLLHSGEWPWYRRNPAGVNDPIIDELCETVKFSLDIDEIEAAVKQIQERMYDPTLPNADSFALAYMTLYSRTYFDTYNPNLRGVVKSPGYGSNNGWTFLNIHWLPETERIEEGKRAAIWTLSGKPDNFNPLYAKTTHEWEIIDRPYDWLTNMNPYNHHDIPWLASDWAITETSTGMEIDFTLRDNVYWQDGNLFTAYDIKFCLEFLRDYHVPIYADTWETLVDVVVTDATHFTIVANKASLDLFYDFSGLAPMLPPQIWDRTWASDQAVLDYDPTESYNVAPGYTAGPNPPPTNLFGTGPWVYQFYDAVNMYCDLWKNENYFITNAEIPNLLGDMFWEVGDEGKDGLINVLDSFAVSVAYGCMIGDECYNANADFNSDGIVDMDDLSNTAYHVLWQKEYP